VRNTPAAKPLPQPHTLKQHRNNHALRKCRLVHVVTQTMHHSKQAQCPGWHEPRKSAVTAGPPCESCMAVRPTSPTKSSQPLPRQVSRRAESCAASAVMDGHGHVPACSLLLLALQPKAHTLQGGTGTLGLCRKCNADLFLVIQQASSRTKHRRSI
jgi:hypothetical protein